MINQIRKALLILRFWVWAAVHRHDFQKFQIIFSPPLGFQFHWRRYLDEICSVRIWIEKPRIDLCVPWAAAEVFSLEQDDVTFLVDSNPF